MNCDITNNISEQQSPNLRPYGITKVNDWLFLGGEDDVDQILNQVDVWIDFRHFGRWNRVIFVPNHVQYMRMPFMDGDSTKVKSVLSNAKLIIDYLKPDNKVLVSCHAGASRSALLATWILAEELGDFDAAWWRLRGKRRLIEFHEGFDEFVQELRGKYKTGGEFDG